MTDFTPGPWTFEDDDSIFHDDDEILGVVGGNGESVLEIDWGGFACESDPNGSYPIIKASKADWELILSAPRLRARVERLEAALRYVRSANSIAGIGTNLAAWEEMHRVIAEALEDR